MMIKWIGKVCDGKVRWLWAVWGSEWGQRMQIERSVNLPFWSCNLEATSARKFPTSSHMTLTRCPHFCKNKGNFFFLRQEKDCSHGKSDWRKIAHWFLFCCFLPSFAPATLCRVLSTLSFVSLFLKTNFYFKNRTNTLPPINLGNWQIILLNF